MKERKIGEIFEFEGKKIEVKKAVCCECDGCILDGKCTRDNRSITGHCEGIERDDSTEVIFVEVQEQPQETEEPKERKIGEVFDYQGMKLKVKEADILCKGCVFEEDCFNRNKQIVGECENGKRKDGKKVVFVDVTEQKKERLNLCNVLKYCPQGETFWSPMLGNVKLYCIDQEAKHVVVTLTSGATWEINHDATITIDEVTSPEIMLYPSREQRDWTKVNYEPKKKLPKTWGEFCKNYPTGKAEYYVNSTCHLRVTRSGAERQEVLDRNMLPNKQAAEAHLALMQLHQLRDAWRDGWLPDWNNDNQSKYAITKLRSEYEVYEYKVSSFFLSFQDEKRADEFKDCFIDLIMKAGDLI